MKAIKRRPDCGYVDSWLWVPKRFVSVEGTKNALTWHFPDENSGAVRIVKLYDETDHHLLLPREFWRVSSLPFDVIDCRPTHFEESPVTSNITLDHKKDRRTGKIIPTGRDVQRRAIEAMMSNQGGILQLACGLGKTVVFLHLISLLRVPALIIVDTTQLLKQWLEEIEWALNVPGGVGLIKGDRMEWNKWIVMATYQTIAARGRSGDFPEQIRRRFGLIGWDEGHHIAAPTYADGAHLFYGRRYALTATPDRSDGLNIIYRFHIGQVILKDLSQDLKPTVIFRWTGLELDHTVPINEVLDKNQQINRGKLSVWYGKWLKRVHMLLTDAKEAVDQGRKVLLLSNSVDEAVNLLAIWTRGFPTELYTDISMPSEMEVQETFSPVYLKPAELNKLKKKLNDAREALVTVKKRLRSRTLHPAKKPNVQKRKAKLEQMIREAEQTLKQVNVGKKIMKVYRARQREYLQALNAESATGGLMVYKMKPDQLKEFLAEKRIVFASMKYGKEGLDDIALDTVMVSMPFSDRNGLQQLMGRPSREDALKKHPLVVIYEDNIGTVIGMCQKLRGHLSSWPIDENGPYEYRLFNHPKARGRRWKSPTVFGQL